MTQATKQEAKTYEDLWHEIKTKKTCSIKLAAASDVLFRRVRNAVVKRKCNDIAFKFELDQNEQRAKLLIERKGSIVTFRLQLTIGLESV